MIIFPIAEYGIAIEKPKRYWKLLKEVKKNVYAFGPLWFIKRFHIIISLRPYQIL